MKRLEILSALVKANQETGEEMVEIIEKKRKIGEKRSEADQKTIDTTKKALHTGLEATDTTLRKTLGADEAIKALLRKTIEWCQEGLAAVLLVRKFETFNRILQGVLDQFSFP